MCQLTGSKLLSYVRCGGWLLGYVHMAKKSGFLGAHVRPRAPVLSPACPMPPVGISSTSPRTCSRHDGSLDAPRLPRGQDDAEPAKYRTSLWAICLPLEPGRDDAVLLVDTGAIKRVVVHQQAGEILLTSLHAATIQSGRVLTSCSMEVRYKTRRWAYG